MTSIEWGRAPATQMHIDKGFILRGREAFNLRTLGGRLEVTNWVCKRRSMLVDSAALVAQVQAFKADKQTASVRSRPVDLGQSITYLLLKISKFVAG